MSVQKSVKIISTLVLGWSLGACDKTTDSFSLLSDQQVFKQNQTYVQKKIDILWVVDNSGSMLTSQTNLANNFRSFIARFQNNKSDFRMAVTTTDAYWGRYTSNNTLSRIKDGVGSTHSGVFVIDQDTLNLDQTFITNIMQGAGGNGDERAFSSFEEALKNPLNSDFRRSDAFLSVIIVSDEDDFSHNDFASGTRSYYFTENYNDSKIYPISYFTDFLNNLTTSTDTLKNYSVNAISIFDQTCLNTLANGSRKIARRYQDLVTATNGITASLCSDFGTSLDLISQSIIELSSIFTLDRKPIIATIQVLIGSNLINEDATNGWTYDASTNTITLHGTAIPQAGESIIINFDPIEVKI